MVWPLPRGSLPRSCSGAAELNDGATDLNGGSRHVHTASANVTDAELLAAG